MIAPPVHDRTETQLAELSRALRAADERRAAARAGSDEHWQALMEIERIEARLAAITPRPALQERLDETPTSGGPALPRSERCREHGCDRARLGALDGVRASPYCAVHILERTSAPER